MDQYAMAFASARKLSSEWGSDELPFVAQNETAESSLASLNAIQAPPVGRILSFVMANTTDASSQTDGTLYQLDTAMKITIVVFFFFMIVALVVVFSKDPRCRCCCCCRVHGREEAKWPTPHEIRLERRLWYQHYLKPYIMVSVGVVWDVIWSGRGFFLNVRTLLILPVMFRYYLLSQVLTEENFVDQASPPDEENQFIATDNTTADSDDNKEKEKREKGKEPECSSQRCNGHLSSCIQRSKDSDSAKHLAEYYHDPVFQSSTPMMKVWDPCDKTDRYIPASCSICINDYRLGDTVVRSANTVDSEYCHHIYHLECMLQWLTYGKKLCPNCRHWFVPSMRIKDQMKLVQVTRSPSSHHLLDANQNVLTSVSESDITDTSLSFSGRLRDNENTLQDSSDHHA